VYEAISFYHDLLSQGDLAAESGAWLDDQLRRRDLVFGGRALCTVLRPRFFTPDNLRRLESRVHVLMRAFRKAYDAAIASAEFRRQFGLLDWEEQLVAVDPGFREPSPTSRLDAFVVEETGEMGLTEYNAETPAGPAFTDALAQAFAAMPVVREFAKRYAMRPLPARHGVLHVLLDAYAQWSGRRDRPRIAILDWHDVPTRREFELFRDYFVEQGFACTIADPNDAEYRNGKLRVAGAPVDLIYKRVLIHELVGRGGLEHPVIRAVRDGAVCMVNPFRSKILHKKASLAVLSDEANAHLFDADELAAVRAFIPWTRVVRERTTTWRGAPVDLVPLILEQRERLVLKPNDDYGGAGIVLGWTVDAAAWERALADALDAPYIVQERLTIPGEPYPSLIDGRLEIFDRMLDTAPFISHGAYMESCLTRLSTAALLNVTAGGGSTVPAFVVEKR
jgi:uncharacterized circularly permuted ATP-grasp superfamily protein